MSNVDTTRAQRVEEFCRFTKEHRELWDKAFAAEAERCQKLDQGDAKYYEQLEKDMKAALEKHLRGVGSSQSGVREGEVLK
jgi:hypothetical protein